MLGSAEVGPEGDSTMSKDSSELLVLIGCDMLCFSVCIKITIVLLLPYLTQSNVKVKREAYGS